MQGRKRFSREHGKGISSMLSFVILVAISLAAILIVLTSTRGTVNDAFGSIDISEAGNILRMMDNRIHEVASEGNGSVRVIDTTTTADFQVMPEDDTITFTGKTSLFDYFTRSTDGNIIFVNGDDVACRKADADSDGDTDLILENSYIRIAFNYVNKSAPLSAIDTNRNIISVQSNVNGLTLAITNSSIIIDGNVTSSMGNGYSEILREGTAMPVCTVHFAVESTVSYDIYYRLYAGADFVTAEVRTR